AVEIPVPEGATHIPVRAFPEDIQVLRRTRHHRQRRTWPDRAGKGDAELRMPVAAVEIPVPPGATDVPVRAHPEDIHVSLRTRHNVQWRTCGARDHRWEEAIQSADVRNVALGEKPISISIGVAIIHDRL